MPSYEHLQETSSFQVHLFTPQHRSENDRHRKIPGYHHQSRYEVDKTQTCSRANRALGFIKINVKIRSPRIKEKLYNSLVRPHVEYASAVGSPHEVKPIHQLEMVQRHATRWTLNRHHDTSSVKRMLEDLQWRTLEQRRTDYR